LTPDFLAFGKETAQGVRFVLVDRSTLLPPHEVVPSNTLTGMVGVLSERFASLMSAPMTEQDALRTLTAAGLSDDDSRRLINQALQRLNWTHNEFLIESPTAIGYRNGHGQVVVRKTDAVGTQPLQRVYAVRCDRCGNHYGANGGDVHDRRCPACQGGTPGLPLPDVAASIGVDESAAKEGAK
jgi:hypothetical protein